MHRGKASLCIHTLQRQCWASYALQAELVDILRCENKLEERPFERAMIDDDGFIAELVSQYTKNVVVCLSRLHLPASSMS